MPKPLRISPVALDSTNRMVLKVAVDLINDEGIACELLPDNTLQSDLLVIDTDNETGQQLLAEAGSAPMKLVISQERVQGKNIVWQEPPVRVIDMKELLILICRPMIVAAATREKQEQASGTSQPVEPALSENDANTTTETPEADSPADAVSASETPVTESPVVESPGSENHAIESDDIEASASIEAAEADAPPIIDHPETKSSVSESLVIDSLVNDSPAVENLEPESPAPADEHADVESPSHEPPPAATAEPAGEDAGPTLAQSLFHVLLNARQNKTCYRVSVSGHQLLIGGHNGTVAADNDQDAKSMLAVPFGELQIEQTDTVAFDGEAQDLHISALDNLLWQAGVDHSDGRLLAGHSLKQTVRLRAWPNFTRNGFRQSHFKLAAIMARQPISLEDLGRQAEVPERDVISFYNSAYAVGLIDRSATAPAASVQKSPPRTRRKGLLGMLARKLGFR